MAKKDGKGKNLAELIQQFTGDVKKQQAKEEKEAKKKKSK